MKPSNSLLCVLWISILSGVSLSVFATENNQKTDDKTLTVKLQELTEAGHAKTPPEKQKIMDDAIEQLRNSHIVDHAVKVGGLDFYVLSDEGSRVAKKFRLVYKLPESLKKLYQQFGVNLEKSNGSKEWELPLGATYVVTANDRVSYAFLDVDYKKRAETRDILDVLKHIQEKK